MTDLEISKALALAIGYAPHHVDVVDLILTKEAVYVFRPYMANHLFGQPKQKDASLWHRFDYTRWQTIAPIAEQLDLFPRKSSAGMQYDLECWAVRHHPGVFKTPQQAIAMAAINLHKQKVQNAPN